MFKWLCLAVCASLGAMPQAQLDSEVLEGYIPAIKAELAEKFAEQCDGRTRRATREYGYSFFKMEQGDYTYNRPPEFLQKLGGEVCRALGDEPVEFTNVILSYYGEGFHLEPHVDVGINNLYKNCRFYFGKKVYGLIVEADPTGHLYFVKWDEDLMPPLDLEPIYAVGEEKGTIFCLCGKLRSRPYFHGVSPVSKQRISITFRTVHKLCGKHT